MWYEIKQSRISSSSDMINFVGTPPFLNLLWVAVETMRFLIAQTGLFFWTTLFCIKGALIFQKMVPMKSCPRVQG